MLFTKKISITLLVFVVILLLYHINILSSLDKLLFFVFNDLETSAVKTGFRINNSIISASTPKHELLQKIASLQSQVNNLKIELLSLKQVEKENSDLRLLLNFKKETNNKLVLANIFKKNNLEIEKSIVINKGEDSGIKKGDPVIVDTGVMIGKVTKTTSKTSLVKLTIDSGSTVLATLHKTEHVISGAVRGMQGTSLVLTHIPKNISISPGDYIITNGMEQGINKGLLLGTILKLQESENEIFNSALIKTPYALEDLTVVSVIISV